MPAYQDRGIGTALVEAGLVELRALGALGCVLVGDPGYYGRFGFHAAAGLTYEGVPDRNVLVVTFVDSGPQGMIRAHEAFSMTLDGGA